MVCAILNQVFNHVCTSTVSDAVTTQTTTKTYDVGMYAMGVISSIHLYFLSKFMENDGIKEGINSYLISLVLGIANSSFMLMGVYYPIAEKAYNTALSILGGAQNLSFMLSLLWCNNHQREKLIYYSWVLGAVNAVLAIPYAGYRQLTT